MNRGKPVILIGGGGHAKVLINALRLNEIPIIGITEHQSNFEYIHGIPVIGNDEEILRYPTDEIQLVNALGSTGPNNNRRSIYETYKLKGYTFANVIHPTAVIASTVKLHEGVQVMAGAIIQPDSIVGENSIINTRVSVDHDCLIGSHVHLAPGTVLSGNIVIESGVHVGTGVTIIQGITVGKDSLLGAGAVVVRDVNANTKVIGVPAREV